MCYCATLAETGACYHSVATSAIGDHPPKGCQGRVSQGLHGCGHTGSSMILIPIFLAKKWETSATKTCNFAGLSKKSHQSWLKAVRVQLPRPGNASPIISLMFNVFFFDHLHWILYQQWSLLVFRVQHESGSFLKAWGSCLSEWWIQHGFDQEYWWSPSWEFHGHPYFPMIFLKHVPHTRNGACFQPSTLNGAPNMDHHPQVVRLICCALPSLTFEHWFQAARNGESCAKMWFNMVWFQLISTRLECGNLSISVFFASVDTYPPPQLSPAGIPEEQHWTPLNTTEWTTRYIYMYANSVTVFNMTGRDQALLVASDFLRPSARKLGKHLELRWSRGRFRYSAVQRSGATRADV